MYATYMQMENGEMANRKGQEYKEMDMKKQNLVITRALSNPSDLQWTRQNKTTTCAAPHYL